MSRPTSLLDFPPKVLENLLWFLPQHSLVNLALTNFQFYEPCAKFLYRNIAIQIDPVLRSSEQFSERRRLDHIESAVTTIGGFGSVTATKNAHTKLVMAKIKTLINSIEINPKLAQYINSVSVYDDYNSEMIATLAQLFHILASIENGIVNVYIAGARLRKKLAYDQICMHFKLTSMVVDDLAKLSVDTLENFPNLEELVIAGVGATHEIDVSVVSVLEKLKHLRIRDEAEVYDKFVHASMKVYSKRPFFLKKLETFNVVHTHENCVQKLPFLDSEKLVNFQISLGCDDYANCDQECLQNSISRFEFRDLKRLAVIQNGSAANNSHKNTEKWDLIVFSLVKDVLEHCDALYYLSIRHRVPLDGIIEDGYEGNYLRKVKLYTIVLPRLLSMAQRHVVNLVLPNFVASLSCYEQPMNTFLWNGCKCKHCAVILEKLDDYILYHRYYNMEKHVYKDMQTVQMVRTMSEVLTDRLNLDANLGDLHCLERPMRNTAWNFHDCKFSIPFQCLPVKTYDINDMEDDAEEARGKVKYFDAEDKPNDCVFLRKEHFSPDYSIVISHFLDDLIRKMINLNRGNAEDADINQVSYENDGWTNLQINKMLINGIDYNFDHEINGTIFYTNSFDDLELQ
ncbi:hypothetical protein OXX59_002320 [Metschnikowia pulcherrima]